MPTYIVTTRITGVVRQVVEAESEQAATAEAERQITYHPDDVFDAVSDWHEHPSCLALACERALPSEADWLFDGPIDWDPLDLEDDECDTY